MNQILKHFILYGAALCVFGPGYVFERHGTDSRVEAAKTYVFAAPDTEMAKSANVPQMFMDTGTEILRRPYAYIVPLPGSCRRHNNWALWSPWLWGRYGLNR